MTRIDIVTDKRDQLGECPLWDDRTQSIYWIDSHDQLVRCLTPATGDYREWLLPSAVGSIALCESGRLLVALVSEFSYLDVATGQLEKMASVDHAEEKNPHERRAHRPSRALCGWLAGGGPQ